jgi:site-specific DNA-methyltransferase (adenine-specific)
MGSLRCSFVGHYRVLNEDSDPVYTQPRMAPNPMSGPPPAEDLNLTEAAQDETTEWLNTVVEADCIEAMGSIATSSVDLLIADPPYNASKGGDWSWDGSVDLPGMGGQWNKIREDWDTMPFADYVRFTAAWLSQARRIVKPTGSLWVHGTYHNIGIVNFVLQALQIEIINEVVWFKRNAFPNLSNTRLTASHETILWAHTGGERREYRFNYDVIKAAAFEEDNIKKRGKQMRTVWDIPNNKSRDELEFGRHPSQKPLRLLRRMFMVSGTPGGICVAPFTGSGSECVAAIEADMGFIGFETEPEYIRIARHRIDRAIQDRKQQTESLF